MRDPAVTAASDVWSGLRLLTRLPRLVRRPISRADAEAALRDRLERRETDFLALVRRGVYENLASPCRRLLAHAGCQPGDLAKLVRADGVEGALRTLLRAGVYLTVDELKGRSAIVRGSMTFVASPASFRNPSARADILTTSGGSRGPRTRVRQDLAFACSRSRLAGVSAGASRCGVCPVGSPSNSSSLWPRSPATPHSSSQDWTCARSANCFDDTGGACDCSGRSDCSPGARSRVRFTRPWQIQPPLVRWFDAARARGETPHVQVYASTGVRLAEAAARMGTDLRGVKFSLTGEPVTPARAGGRGHAGSFATNAPGLVHPTAGAPCPLKRLPRRCRYAVRSSVRLSDGRPRLDDAPGGGPEPREADRRRHDHRRFGLGPRAGGGAPRPLWRRTLDYQLVEEETATGDPALRLRVHPAVGVLDSP
jgi:hypothetical protein